MTLSCQAYLFGMLALPSGAWIRMRATGLPRPRPAAECRSLCACCVWVCWSGGMRGTHPGAPASIRTLGFTAARPHRQPGPAADSHLTLGALMQHCVCGPAGPSGQGREACWDGVFVAGDAAVPGRCHAIIMRAMHRAAARGLRACTGWRDPVFFRGAPPATPAPTHCWAWRDTRLVGSPHPTPAGRPGPPDARHAGGRLRQQRRAATPGRRRRHERRHGCARWGRRWACHGLPRARTGMPR